MIDVSCHWHRRDAKLLHGFRCLSKGFSCANTPACAARESTHVYRNLPQPNNMLRVPRMHAHFAQPRGDKKACECGRRPPVLTPHKMQHTLTPHDTKTCVDKTEHSRAQVIQSSRTTEDKTRFIPTSPLFGRGGGRDLAPSAVVAQWVGGCLSRSCGVVLLCGVCGVGRRPPVHLPPLPEHTVSGS